MPRSVNDLTKPRIIDSIVHVFDNELTQYDVDYEGQIIYISKFKFIKLTEKPKLIYHVVDPTYQIANQHFGMMYLYDLYGEINVINLGIFIMDPVKQNSIKSASILGGKYYDHVVRAIGNATHVGRKIIHVVTGPMTRQLITGNCTDLIPGVIGPIKAQGKIVINWDTTKYGPWSGEFQQDEVIKKFAPGGMCVKEVNTDDVFYIIGENLYIMKKIDNGIPVDQEIVNRYMLQSYHAYDQKNIKELLKYPYSVIMPPVDEYRMIDGLCELPSKRSASHVKLEEFEYTGEVY